MRQTRSQQFFLAVIASVIALALVMTWTMSDPASSSPAGGESLTPSLAGTANARSLDGISPRSPLRRFEVRWRRVAGGLNQPTQVTSAPDGRKRLFVVQKPGSVLIVRDGKVAGTPYLRLNGRIDPSGEGGLLSIAFSPSFRQDGLLWVAYSRKADGDLVIGRMRARNEGANRVRSSTLKQVLRVEHSQFDNHYGGQLMFGPGQRLFIGTGDGGSGGDPGNNAQQREDLRGKILRINPFGSCGDRRYCVPDRNPFVGKKGRNEVWLMGLRNPWRFSFDKRSNDLWIGDVGQDQVEEIDRVPPNPRRINLGWSCKEGRQTYIASRCRKKVDYLGPETVVRQETAQAITGGFVYRGSRFRKQIAGTYVFADFITSRVWMYRPAPGKVVQPQRLNGGPTSFGVDDRGEIYAVTIDGTLWRMRVVRR